MEGNTTAAKEFEILGQKVRYLKDQKALSNQEVSIDEVLQETFKLQQRLQAPRPYASEHELAVLMVLELMKEKIALEQNICHEIDDIQHLALETHQLLDQWCSPS